VLLHVLEDQFNVKLQPEELLAEFPEEEEEGMDFINNEVEKRVGSMTH